MKTYSNIACKIIGMTMARCFVIQPFDKGKFDKRYEDIFKPAIEKAGLEPYRVDQDPSVDVPIQAIEKEIRGAAICLADITTDNPNVWYELGFAFAANKPVVMVCSEERKGRFPFDIQHRTILQYKSESVSDFEKLKKQITERIVALLKQKIAVGATDADMQLEKITQTELAILSAIAKNIEHPQECVPINIIKEEVVSNGIQPLQFISGYQKLLTKKYVSEAEELDVWGEPYLCIRLTKTGLAWIESN